MNTTNQSNMEDGATPSMLWCNIAEYIGMLSKSMMKTYRQRSRGNHQITWGELDKVNKDLHDQLDIIIAGNRNVQTISENNNALNENRNMKQTIRLTESELKHLIRESVKKILKEGKKVNHKPYFGPNIRPGDPIPAPDYDDVVSSSEQFLDTISPEEWSELEDFVNALSKHLERAKNYKKTDSGELVHMYK